MAMQTTHVRTAADLTPSELMVFLLTVEDDTEDAPWMTMGDAQFWTATSFASTLHIYALTNGLPWYVAGMLPILYRRPSKRKGQVAPDVMVAFVPQRPRQSYDLDEEGVFPQFVLEVLSPSSIEHDQEDKLLLYDNFGAREYVLFAPHPTEDVPPLQGYRRDAEGRFEPWPLDAQGRLWSAELGLYVAVEGGALRALRRDGQPLLTHEESEIARLREAEQRAEESAARRQAEEELAQLRALLERQRAGE